MVKQFSTGLVFLLATLFGAHAQTKVEKAIAKTIERLRVAMIDGNKIELENIASDKLSYGHSSGRVEGKAEFVEKIVSGQSDFVTIELKGQVISVNGGTAIVRHKLNAVTNDNGKPGEVHLYILLVFQKEHRQWKLLARQAVKTN